MGWHAENPELYDEICTQAILDKMRNPQHIGRNRFDRDEVKDALIEAFECYPVKLALCDWAAQEISLAEGEHRVGDRT